jgi:hypothetical protein
VAVQAVLAGVGLRAEMAVVPPVPQSDVIVQELVLLGDVAKVEVLHASYVVADVVAQGHRTAPWFSRE